MNNNTVLAIAFLIFGTLLTTTAITTMVPAAYADNKQKAEDDSAAAIADCDDNDVERAGFDCIAIAANDVEIETEPPAEERATLSVCKEVISSGFEPSDFTFTVEGNNPDPEEFQGDNEDLCVDVDIGPGQYAISEVGPITGGITTRIAESSDCVQDPTNPQRATGEIQAGETQECRFINAFID